MDHYHTDPIPTPEGQSHTHMCVGLFLVTCELCIIVMYFYWGAWRAPVIACFSATEGN